MKRVLTIAAIVIVMAGFVEAKPEAPIVGTFTNITHTVTNNAGRRWIQSVGVQGVFTNGIAVRIILNNSLPRTSDGYYLAASTTIINSLIYDGTGNIAWEDKGVIKFDLPGATGLSTNTYFINTETK